MTKYYRVRTQEQWDWLKNKLEIKGDLHVSYFPVTILDGDVFCGIYKYHDDPEPLIEVSQMMEDEKMENGYVTIKGEDLEKVHWETNYGRVSFINYDKNGEKYAHEQFLPASLSISKSLLYPKVRMSVAEKKEFDELKSDWQVLICAFDAINEIDYPRWFSRLNDYPDDNDKHQLEFARAWADESLIEVIPDKKWEVKVPRAPDHYYFKDTDNELVVSYASDGTESRKQFTAEELKHYGLDNDLFEKVEVSE